MSMPIAFLICTEPGRLEKQSLLLAESIRKFGGNLKNTPIYSFHPRQGNPIDNQTIKAFESLGVNHEQIVLNTDFHDYYLANKPFVCAYAEQHIDADILVFLDSDKCFFNEPNEFILPLKCNVGLRPEYGRGIGSTGISDIQDEYWQNLYKLLGVKQELFVNTPIGNRFIRAYWNSGMISVRRDAGIFTAWKNNFRKVMEHQLTPRQGVYFVEQSTLSATICAELQEPEIFTFSPAYSYPLPLHNRLSKNYKLTRFDDMVSIHYFNMFYYYDWSKRLKNLRNIDKNSDQYNWLCQKIQEYDMPFRNSSHDYMLKLRMIESKLSNFNIKINLSNLIEKWL